MLSDRKPDASPPPFFPAGSRRLVLFRGTPVRFWQHLHRVSFLRRRAGIGICSPTGSFVTDRVLYRLFVIRKYIYIYIRVSSSLCPFPSSVSEGRVLMFLCSFVTGRLSLSFPFYDLLFGSRPRWSRLVSPRTRVVTRQRKARPSRKRVSKEEA